MAAPGTDTSGLTHRCAVDGTWELVVGTPAPALRGVVLHYTGYVTRRAHPEPLLEPPSTVIALIITLGSPYRVSGPANRAAPSLHHHFVAGLHDSFAVVSATGPQECVQIDLTPLGAYQILGVPMAALANRTIDLADLLGPLAARLADHLHTLPDWSDRFALLDRLLVGRLAAARAPAPGVAHAWRRLVEAGGDLAIGDLAADLGWSRKHLFTRLREQIGLPPKLLGRILRFERLLRQIDRGDERTWATLAHATGYYDQAHLIRDVRQFTGCTPEVFRQRRRPDGIGILAI